MAFDSFIFYNPFSYFQYLDFSSFYSQYSVILDFFIYLLIFVGLARVVFEERFQGRGGKALIIGIGTALAASLAISESRIGFNLLSFSPIAGFIVTLLVALVLYNLIRKTGASVFVSVPVSILIIYLGIGAATPGLFTWISAHMPFINIVFFLAFLILLFKVVMYIASHVSGSGLSTALDSLGGNVKENLALEKQTLTSLDPIIRQEREEIKTTAHKLNEIYHDLERNAPTKEVISAIRAELQRAKDREYIVRQKLDHLETVNRKLTAFDLGLFHDIKAKYEELPENLKGKVRKDIQRERMKIYDENRFQSLASTARTHLSDFEAALQMADHELAISNIENAKTWLLKAINSDMRIDYLFSKLQRLERQLLAMIPKRIETITKRR